MSDQVILIVDDKPTFAATLVRTLERRGLAARSAADRATTLATTREINWQRVGLALNLAGISGLGLIP